MKSALFFILTVGIAWALLEVWLFLSLAGIADAPISLAWTAFYWTAMMVGPATLIAGSGTLLRRGGFKYGVILIVLGCVIFTAYVLYNSIVGMQRGPLQAPPTYWFYAILLALMLATDFAGFKIVSIEHARVAQTH